MARDDAAIRVDGLREFRRDLKRLGPAVDKEFQGEIREGAGPILAESRATAPRLTGEYARSLKLSVTRRGVSIYSTLPQAPVLHWGGVIRPRGVPIRFPRTEHITRTAERHADRLVENTGDAVERAADRVGWHR